MSSINEVKPILRWAGGKTWLVKHLDQLLPKDGFVNYHEPFLGGGAIFIALNPQKEIFLSDSNTELINAYQCIKDDPNEVYALLSTYKNTEVDYYSIRKQLPVDAIEKAARFIYLNQTSFNGLYRVNRAGQYNVPYGKRKQFTYTRENLFAMSNRLKNAVLYSGDFEMCINNVKKRDLVFLDPPYVVAKDDNTFIGYNQHLFSLNDQKRLSHLIDLIKEKEAYYMLTNAKHPTIYEIFDKNDNVFEFKRASLIGGGKDYRGITQEYVFTNIK